MRPELCLAAGTPGIFGRNLLGSYDRYLQIFECANDFQTAVPGFARDVLWCDRLSARDVRKDNTNVSFFDADQH